MTACGKCTLCCTVMKVAMEPPKPAHAPCGHCTSRGCAIYADRPEPCRVFQCVWLGSQQWPDARLAPALRPDRCGVVLEVNSAGYIIAHGHRPGSWRRDPVHGWLRRMAQRTRVLVEHDGDTMLLHASGATEALARIGVDPATNETLYVRADALADRVADYVDFDRYMAGHYTPPPELTALPDWPLIRSGWGGQGLGVPGTEDRAAAARGEGSAHGD